MSLNGWNIDTAAVQGVISEVQRETEMMKAEQAAMRNALESTAESVNSALITNALAEVHDLYLAPLVTSGWQRAERVKDQTSLAVQAYVSGDQEMAENANNQASREALSVAPERIMRPEE